jgi:hypothetical protein
VSDKLFGGAVALIVAANLAWWGFIAYIAYRVLTRFGIL